METNDIKKALYKEKPIAHQIHQNELYMKVYNMPETKAYSARTSLGVHFFDVPISEMGEVEFEKTIPAQLLIRWLIKLP